jgi:non-ribosomal peptide synthase protein (TIGR01720 family)
MVPTLFITIKSLPLLPNHKVDRRLLPAPEDLSRQRREPEPPRNSTEEKLVRLWAGALLIERVGIYDNFFELGGDSIISIQLVSRARREGICITVNQVFQYPTIAQLALVAETAAPIIAAQGRVMGDVPLTPIQRWFFEQNFVNLHHSNQAAFFEIRMPLSPTLISKAVQSVVQHHDALRLRFESTAAGWRQFHVSEDAPVEVETIDLSTVPAGEQVERMERSAAAIQSGLDISKGPLVRVALFNFGRERPQHLLFVIHHLVVDTVSWRILMEDFWNAYSQLGRSETVQLPPKTTSFQAWSQQLSQYAQSPSISQELDYWLQPIEHDYRLPIDHSTGDNTLASARTITVKINAQETQALLQEVPQAYQTQINDVLLTALVQAFQTWTGFSTLRIDLEGHGREDVVKDVDIARTVGWFTSLFPVQLDLTGIDEAGAALKSIKEQLRRIPNRGIGYGLLRYLTNDDSVRQRLHSVPPAQISFNYLGQFGHADPEGSPIVTATASYGPLASPAERRRSLLDINAVVAQGEIQFAWTYSDQIHRESTIEALAHQFIDALRKLITHCQSAEAGGYTPSDFSKARLSQTELDDFLGDLEQEIGNTSQ